MDGVPGALRDLALYALVALMLLGPLEVFLRFRLLQGVLRPDEYQEVTAALLAALEADGRVAGVLEGTDRAHLIGPPPPAP